MLVGYSQGAQVVGDAVGGGGGGNLGAHLDYTQKYNNAASTFVTQRLNAAGIH